MFLLLEKFTKKNDECFKFDVLKKKWKWKTISYENKKKWIECLLIEYEN